MTMKPPTPIVIYTASNGRNAIQVKLENGTLWLSQKQLTELFGKAKGTVSEHITHIFEDDELNQDSVVRFFRTTAADGKLYEVAHYNLDMILAVGFRVRSPAGVKFRQWANETLKSYLQKGFLMDDDRLKNPDGSNDYFEEMLARIRDIRASEKRFYQKLRDLFTLSVDYDAQDSTVQTFYAQTQNKILFAITGQTAAELIFSRANVEAPHMGLLHWAGSASGSKLRKTDVVIAKNYLTEQEVDLLNRFVVVFLETAELRARNQQTTTMNFWRDNIDKIIALNDKPLLQSAGSVSHTDMLALVDSVYASFDQQRKTQSARDADLLDLDELKALESEIKNVNNLTSQSLLKKGKSK